MQSSKEDRTNDKKTKDKTPKEHEAAQQNEAVKMARENGGVCTKNEKDKDPEIKKIE